ncbi:MAG TPA: hypothetical protein PKC29_00870 [Thermodesulfobacteriota bacterium]|nr:hypothetical protein [Thermodesulfobacteriota bacterium]
MKNPDWTRKLVLIAGILNIIALLTILLSIFRFTPLSLIISVSVGGALIGLSVLLYIVVVVTDLKERGVL